METEEIRAIQTEIAMNLILSARRSGTPLCEILDNTKADNRLTFSETADVYNALYYIIYQHETKSHIMHTDEDSDIVDYVLVNSIRAELNKIDEVSILGRKWRRLNEDEKFVPNEHWRHCEVNNEDWLVAETEEGKLWMNNYSGYMVLVRENDSLICYI